VLAVASNHRVHTATGTATATDLAKRLPGRAWHRRSCGPGAKGHRTDLWAWIDVVVEDAPGCFRLLIRRNPRTGEPKQPPARREPRTRIPSTAPA
jgi:hypothetical protein